ncbi:hypothetical protein BJ166DRAFT_383 [Pestalotiopsis sp. NC0098]|nr:hypothetical protein BJ166DRAFT_383 [Pestalotiopsis sp. NC0098]
MNRIRCVTNPKTKKSLRSILFSLSALRFDDSTLSWRMSRGYLAISEWASRNRRLEWWLVSQDAMRVECQSHAHPACRFGSFLDEVPGDMYMSTTSMPPSFKAHHMLTVQRLIQRILVYTSTDEALLDVVASETSLQPTQYSMECYGQTCSHWMTSVFKRTPRCMSNHVFRPTFDILGLVSKQYSTIGSWFHSQYFQYVMVGLDDIMRCALHLVSGAYW